MNDLPKINQELLIKAIIIIIINLLLSSTGVTLKNCESWLSNSTVYFSSNSPKSFFSHKSLNFTFFSSNKFKSSKDTSILVVIEALFTKRRAYSSLLNLPPHISVTSSFLKDDKHLFHFFIVWSASLYSHF